MKLFSNERGAALIMVLFLIVFMGLLFTVAGFQLTSTGKQVTLSQKHLQAENLAVMGQDYFRSFLNKIEPEIVEGDTSQQILEYWGSETTITMDDASLQTEYTVRVFEHPTEPNKLQYESIGRSGEVEEVIEGTVTIESAE
ncbi:hypothetical protein [Halobacillus campisalis]|uniref:Type 4 fimbrial biogenesis protein PilX N-terminal domain-containing protein n=1 Tax=Halobacillus campisalis TaxID=435909 RepID=A0ABW2K4G1_9BACI|nr:hypothetical protein [Halobacillus campisalis]